MYLPIPTSVIFLFLGIASFAPLASHWPGWWMAYYGALLACWVVASVTAMRRVARRERREKQRLRRTVQGLQAARRAPGDTADDAVPATDLDGGRPSPSLLDIPKRAVRARH
jgi:hypothetical protein